MVIEEVRHEHARRWRSALALGAAASIGVGAAALAWQGWTHPELADGVAPTPYGALFLPIGANLAITAWLPRRRRRGALCWLEAVVGPRGVGPGLLIRRSLWRVAGVTVLLAPMVLVGIAAGAALAATGEVWRGILYFGTGVGAAALASRLAYWWIRFSGTAALTTEGVQRATDFIEWDNILRAVLNRDGSRINGVRIVARRAASIRSGGRSIIIGGGNGTVPDEDLLAAVEFFRTNPHQRALLGTPDALRVLAHAPRPPEDRQR